jgi:hypothetical protein
LPLPAFVDGVLPAPALELEPAALLALPPAPLNPLPGPGPVEEQANDAKKMGESRDQSWKVRIMA